MEETCGVTYEDILIVFGIEEDTVPLRKAPKKWKLHDKIILLIGILLIIYPTAMYAQHMRYDINGYNCVGMTEDARGFFDAIGFDTSIGYGIRLDDEGNSTGAHCWLILNTIFGQLEFESTALIFDSISEKWDVVELSQGVHHIWEERNGHWYLS